MGSGFGLRRTKMTPRNSHKNYVHKLCSFMLRKKIPKHSVGEHFSNGQPHINVQCTKFHVQILANEMYSKELKVTRELGSAV